MVVFGDMGVVFARFFISFSRGTVVLPCISLIARVAVLRVVSVCV